QQEQDCRVLGLPRVAQELGERGTRAPAANELIDIEHSLGRTRAPAGKRPERFQQLGFFLAEPHRIATRLAGLSRRRRSRAWPARCFASAHGYLRRTAASPGRLRSAWLRLNGGRFPDSSPARLFALSRFGLGSRRTDKRIDKRLVSAPLLARER